ncbi:MAG: hypothetical protein M3128_08040 [Verrucomicrobiota bacterium]|nr:hypothetical protein [Verrucomicrobiota bacterium]
MKKILASIFLGIISSAHATLDFTPNEINAASDGPALKRYYFRDGRKQLTFRIDNKMSVNGSSDAAAFRFQDMQGAATKLARSQTSAHTLFDEKNLASYRNVARTSLPADAADVQMEEERANPITINGWTSYRFIFSYKLFGNAQRRSITFINYSDAEQLIFDVSATADDYQKVYARSFKILNSISDLPVDPNGPT